MRKPDAIRLRHMLDAAREALSFAEGAGRDDLATDRKTTLSIVKAIEMIGEAASKVSAECQGELPRIPWPEIVAMGNRLVHAYFDIDIDRVWETVTDDLPELIEKLEEALLSEGEQR